jgi:hypothetical protein
MYLQSTCQNIVANTMRERIAARELSKNRRYLLKYRNLVFNFMVPSQATSHPLSSAGRALLVAESIHDLLHHGRIIFGGELFPDLNGNFLKRGIQFGAYGDYFVAVLCFSLGTH